MESVIGVRFKKTGKLYYFYKHDLLLKLGENVVAGTERGEELGRVVKITTKDKLPEDINIDEGLRLATKKDLNAFKENEKKADEALIFCKEEARRLKLNMKLLAAEYTLDLSKIIFYFVAEDRVDFRELVKSLASKYRARIELRQIGPRDEVKIYPNLGMCGKEVCCRTFLQDFEPVTIKMAKEQGLQINMQKLSGACGKLMCCLKYEEQTYKENLEKLPKVGQVVSVDGESGKVTGVEILKLKVKVKFSEGKDDERYEVYPVEKLKWNKEN